MEMRPGRVSPFAGRMADGVAGMKDGPDRDFLGGGDMQVQVDPASLFVEIRIGVNDDDADADARHDAVRRRADPAIRPPFYLLVL